MRFLTFLILTFSLCSQKISGQPFHSILEKDLHSLSTHSNSYPRYIQEEKKDSLKEYLPHVFCYNRNQAVLYLNPLIDWSNGVEFSADKMHHLTETGVSIKSSWGNNLCMSLDFSLGFSDFTNYSDSFIKTTTFVPGKGFATLRASDFSYNNHRFYAAYKFSKYIIAEAGYGKSFFGEGYRSLFLSANSSPYPYIKLTTQAWNLKYINLWAELNDFKTSTMSNRVEPFGKYACMHFLSWNVTKRLNLNFFEAIVWQNQDSLTTQRGFDVHYANPIILYRPVEFNLGSPDNSLLGLGFSYRIGKANTVYGQFLIDDIIFQNLAQDFKHLLKPNDSTILYGSWMSKQALQFGFKTFNFLSIPNLFFLAETNIIRPYTYSHVFPVQNFAHNNQPLAHPYGSNLKEISGIFSYKKNNWQLVLKMAVCETGLDSANSHFGQNIFNPTFDAVVAQGVPAVKQWKNNIGQGIKTIFSDINFKLYYTVHKKTMLRAYLEFSHRKTSCDGYFANKNESFVGLGLRTTFSDIFFDNN